MIVQANRYYDLYISAFITSSNNLKVSFPPFAVDKFVVALAISDSNANRTPLGPPQLRSAMDKAGFSYEEI